MAWVCLDSIQSDLYFCVNDELMLLYYKVDLPDSHCPTLFWLAAFLQLFGVTCESRKCSQCQHDASVALLPSQLQTLHSRFHMVSDQHAVHEGRVAESILGTSRPLSVRFRGQHAVERMRTDPVQINLRRHHMELGQLSDSPLRALCDQSRVQWNPPFKILDPPL